MPSARSTCRYETMADLECEAAPDKTREAIETLRLSSIAAAKVVSRQPSPPRQLIGAR